MTTEQEVLLKHMLHARTQLVMNYLTYIEFIADKLKNGETLHNESKTAEDCNGIRMNMITLRQLVAHSAEQYAHCYAAYAGMTTAMQNELARRVMQDIYPPLERPAGPPRDLYPGKLDWLNNPMCKDS